ncbi:MAG: Rne/Rng family ribonuclease [Proteobacteria bacterium]|nr:Rne/Rng family ribonuclease [Pseudomonadota bacterium]MBU1716161.1 Rne/Rng family ribonuclease [Pseudomonadota bacterium]
MAKDIIKPKTNHQPVMAGEKEKSPTSVISRISKWLIGKTKNENPATNPSQKEPQTQTAGDAKSQDRPSSTHRKRKPYPRRRKSNAANRNRPPESTTEKTIETEKKGNPPVKSKKPQTQKATPEIIEENEPTENIPLKLLINTDEPEECRIALLEDGRVESFYVETVVHAQTKGNIYKGKIVAVEPSLQAAFVELGTDKNGFLPFSEIHPEYYYTSVPADTHWKDLKIQDVVRKGSEVLVQVVKEATGNKGANMTTYLSMPGRYLVLMPGSDSRGVSKKIESESQRDKLRKIIDSMDLPEGIGYIVRTASKEMTKTSLTQDLKYLLNLWQEIKDRGQSMPVPSLIYKEQNIISRFMRDHFTSDIQEILVDNSDAYKQVKAFLDLLPAANQKTTVSQHRGSRPIFNQYKVEKQIEQIYQPTVQLPSGGSIVISPTEALVAIDVNSGRTSKDKDFEESIFLANKEAAVEMARQLRLRDLGGLIVVDFIDMRDTRHNREVEKIVKASMKRDKAKVDISRISKFGLMQISRQKMASPIQLGSYHICEHCQGRGLVRSVETLSLSYLRRIQTGVIKKKVESVDCQLPEDAAKYLLEKKKHEIEELEKRYHAKIHITARPDIKPSEEKIEFNYRQESQ